MGGHHEENQQMTEQKTKLPAKSMGFALFAMLTLGLVKPWEGFEPMPYRDIVGVLTVCYGQTGTAAQIEKRWTESECSEMLGKELMQRWSEMQKCIRPNVELHPHEAAAILSWAYNIGNSAACNSTLFKRMNSGEPGAQWCAELDRWVYVRKLGVPVKVNGLVNRRAAERAICEGRYNEKVSNSDLSALPFRAHFGYRADSTRSAYGNRPRYVSNRNSFRASASGRLRQTGALFLLRSERNNLQSRRSFAA